VQHAVLAQRAPHEHRRDRQQGQGRPRRPERKPAPEADQEHPEVHRVADDRIRPARDHGVLALALDPHGRRRERVGEQRPVDEPEPGHDEREPGDLQRQRHGAPAEPPDVEPGRDEVAGHGQQRHDPGQPVTVARRPHPLGDERRAAPRQHRVQRAGVQPEHSQVEPERGHVEPARRAEEKHADDGGGQERPEEDHLDASEY
jgi:hypothetical protein